MNRSQRDGNNNNKQRNKRRSVDSGNDDGSGRKRFKFRHANKNVADETVYNAGVDVNASSQAHSKVKNVVTKHTSRPKLLIPKGYGADQIPASSLTVPVAKQLSIEFELIDEYIAEDAANIVQGPAISKLVEPAAEPEPHQHQFSDLNDDCVMEILKRLDINGLASIAGTNKFMKTCAEDVFLLTHRGHLALNFIEGEEDVFHRTVNTFGPLATSMCITDLSEKIGIKANCAVLAAANHKTKWNIQTMELDNVKLDLSELNNEDKLKILALFAAVDKLIIKDSHLMECDLLFEFLKHKLVEIAIDDSDLDFGMLREYPNLRTLKIKFMGEYCDHHKEFHRSFIEGILMDNDSIEELELMCCNFKQNQLVFVTNLYFLQRLTLNIRKHMDLLPISHMEHLKTLTLFGNSRVNVSSLMLALDNHTSVATVHLNNIMYGSRLWEKTSINFEH